MRDFTARLDAITRSRPRRPPAAIAPRPVRMEATGDVAHVYVYDYIGVWGVGADEFVKTIASITTSAIDLHVNSGGGDVFDATAMYTSLANHKASVTARIEGIAASAASFLVMAADEIVIEKPARMMIHDALTLTYGDEADHIETGSLLGEISDTIAEIYADRAGGTVADWRDTMRAERWYSAQQAVEAGLADRVNSTSASDAAPEDLRTQTIRARARARKGVQ
jgi:ATP-dependent protease ClpP protease subunit